MRPILKLDDIRDLHDARYCAAVGISLLSFKIGNGTGAMAPATVGEIMEWLSGPEGVAVFGDEPPHEINAMAALARCQYVSIPVDYPMAWISEIDLPLIIRVEGDASSDIENMLALATRFPQANWELMVGATSTVTAPDSPLFAMLPKMLLRSDDPDSIYSVLKKYGTQPWGFTLGGFVVEGDGSIDYTRCDEFVEAYFALPTV